MKTTIFYKTTADFDNTGEVLIYKSLLEFLRKYGDIIINDGAGVQPKFLERIGIVDSERLSKKTSLKFIPFMILKSLTGRFKREKIFFVTGVGEHSVAGLKSSIKNIASFIFLLILRFCGVTVVRIGMSMRIHGTMAALSEKILSCAVDYYYVRDSISLDNCRNAGVKKCRLAPDLSWGYIIPQIEESENRKDVYMSFRFFCESEKNCGEYQKKLIQSIKIIAENVSKKIDGCIVFSYQCDADKDFMYSIYKQLSFIPNLIMSNELITLQNAKKYYGNAQIIFSNRLHVLLLGYKYGAPTVCVSDIEKHRKIRGIFCDNGLENLLVDINQDEDEIVSKVMCLLENKNESREKYKAKETENYLELESIFNNIFDK